MSSDFYAPRQQLRRELRMRWRHFGRGKPVSGTIITLLAFYPLNSPGFSQVYDVALPYLFAAIHVAAIILTQTQVERTRPTAAFFLNLPRERSVRVSATALYFLAHALYYELIIALGIYLKLGSADITPFYRVHPELAMLPFVAVIVALWYCHQSRHWIHKAGTYVGLISLAAALFFRHFVKPEASPENGFLPPRDIALGVEWAVALLLLAIGVAVFWRLCNGKAIESGAVA